MNEITDKRIDNARNTERIVTMRDVLTILFRHKYKIILFFASTVSVVTLITLMTPKVYSAKATLLIRLGRENLSVDPSVVGPTTSVYQRRETEINSELSILESRLVVEKVVDDIGVQTFIDQNKNTAKGLSLLLQNCLNSLKLMIKNKNEDEKQIHFLMREKVIEEVIKNLHVSIEKDSNIITLTYFSKNPLLSKHVLELLINFYLDHHINVHGPQTTASFFQKQSDELFNKLSEKEEKLKKFYLVNNIVSIEKQKELILEQISNLQNEVYSAKPRISALKAKVRALQKNLQGQSKVMELNRVTGKSNAVVATLKSRLIDLRLKEADLSSRYPDDYRLLIDVRSQIKFAEKALSRENSTNTEITTGIDENYQRMDFMLNVEKSNYEEQVARYESLSEELMNSQQKLSKFIEQESAIKNLEREIEILQKEYLKYQENQQRAEISEALDKNRVSNISIVQSASAGLTPVKPKAMIIILLSIVSGLFGGLCFAFIADFMDDSISSIEDIEIDIGLPVLAAISNEEFRSCI